MFITIQFLNGQREMLDDIEIDDTVGILKEKINAAFDFTPPAEKLKIVYGTTLLQNGDLLTTHNIFDETCIMCVWDPVIEPEEVIPESTEAIFMVQNLNGTKKMVRVDSNMSFGKIKSKILEKEFDTPAVQQRLIYVGRIIPDEMTPASCKIMRESIVHLTKHFKDENDIIDGVITKDKLRCNCPYCQKAGVEVKPRPMCKTCDSEALLLENGHCDVGKVTWGGLRGLKAMCFQCQKIVDVNIGFLCHGRPGDAEVCHSRAAEREPDGTLKLDKDGNVIQKRQMLFHYKGGSLIDCLNTIYSYAHGCGFQVFEAKK